MKEFRFSIYVKDDFNENEIVKALEKFGRVTKTWVYGNRYVKVFPYSKIVTSTERNDSKKGDK